MNLQERRDLYRLVETTVKGFGNRVALVSTVFLDRSSTIGLDDFKVHTYHHRVASPDDVLHVCSKPLLAGKVGYREEPGKAVLEFKEKTWTFPTGPAELMVRLIRRSLFEVFYSERYGFLDVEGKAVLDGGGVTGASCVDFAARGAASVFSMEGLASSADLVNEVISVNGIQERCQALSIMVPPHGSSTLEKAMAAMPKGSVCRLDLAGAERALVGVRPEVLRRFDQFAVEYHDYGYRLIVDRLERAGFEVRVDGPHDDIRRRFDCVGLVAARLSSPA